MNVVSGIFQGPDDVQTWKNPATSVRSWMIIVSADRRAIKILQALQILQHGTGKFYDIIRKMPREMVESAHMSGTLHSSVSLLTEGSKEFFSHIILFLF